MARYLGIDYGTKRMGFSLSDEREMMAFPHGVFQIEKLTPEKILAYIGELCKKENIEGIVLGVPRGLSHMQDTEMTDRVFRFGDELKILGHPVHFEEEFLSTQQVLRGPTPREKVDASAATLILQTYLERKKGMVK
jgi:putative holliday junction resolvase